MKYGYARVSTDDQNLALQLDALNSAGCDLVFADEGISGTESNRPQLDELMNCAAEGDQIIVWRLDRLGRSVPHLIETVNGFQNRGVQFASLAESIDTQTANGKLIFTIFAAIAEFEKDLLSERTKAGLQAAKARGRTLGRPRKLSRAKVEHAKELLSEGRTKREVCHLLGVSPATLWRYISAG